MTTGPPPPTLRSRLVWSFVGVALGVLVVAGGATLAFSRANERRDARDELLEQAEALTPLLNDVSLQQVRGLLPVLRVQDAALLRLTVAGEIAPADALPPGLAGADVDVEALRAGETVTGSRGSLVFVAHPLDAAGPLVRPTRGAPRRQVDGTPLLVLTRDVGPFDLGGLGPWLLTAGGIALVLAGVVGALLARRLTRPLVATQRAAHAIASGDLSARVGEAGLADRELAEVARAFDDMAGELEKTRSLTRDFLMSVSHDLRTPLTSIRGYAEAIAEGTVRSQPERRRAASVIEGEARRLERLVSDLLDLARLDARRFTLEPRPTDPAMVVEAVASGMEPLADEHGVALEVNASPVAERNLDAERLGQVVANLVENALKYAASRVTVTTRERRGAMVVEVADDGPGIPATDLPRVFDRLYTTRPVEGRKVGTGLGLAIVHELVTAMDGFVEAESGSPPAAGGATFRVVLP